jgi:CubicO group peptidase (beta-lactamase class C family)
MRMRPGSSPSRIRDIDAVVASFIERGVVAGAVTLVARKGEIAHLSAQGHMDIAASREMRTDTIFRLASMTKLVVSAAILMLIEDGQLWLTDPVSTFIPEFGVLSVATATGLVRASPEITLHDLLTHTAGLGCGPSPALLSDVPGGASASDALADVVPRMASIPLCFQPGTEFGYSPELGFDVLGRVIEIASGQSLDEFLRRRIFEPLGAADLFFHVPPSRLPDVAAVYMRTPVGLRPVKPAGMLAFSTMSESRYLSGSGGLVGTAEAYGRFAVMLAQGGELDGHRLLPRTAVDLMPSNQVGQLPLHTPYIDLTGYRFGLGVRVLDDPGAAGSLASRGTFGWSGAFNTEVWIDPVEQMVSLLLIQRMLDPEDAALRSLGPRIETAVYQALT